MGKWIESVFFGIHYDFHAGPDDVGLGSTLTPELLRERLLRVRPDWIHCDCKGHRGYTSWPTKVGSTSPGVVKDSLRVHRDVTRELGIRLGMHYSGVWDQRALELHPDWARLDADGKPDLRLTCRHSRYLDDLMIPQLLELLDVYQVDGFWVDGDNWASAPCWCARCTAEFTRRTGSAAIPRTEADPQWRAWLAYHRDLFIAYVERWTAAVHGHTPECVATSSFMYGARQPDPRMTAELDYLSGDLDFRWGAQHALLEARVYDGRRRAAGRPLPFNLMAWMFQKPGEMGDERTWQHKPVVHLCQEVSSVLAQGGAVMVYENPQRTGHLVGWHHEAIAGIADFCRARQSVCVGTETIPQAAVLHFAETFYRRNVPLYQYEPGTDPIEGALHALLETQHAADVLTEDAAAATLDQYPLVIVPEADPWPAALAEQVRRYVENGGHLLVSGAHLARDFTALVGAQPRGAALSKNVWLPSGAEAVAAAGEWQPVEPEAGTEVLVRRLANQDPELNRTDDALITRRRLGRGTVVAAHGPLFAAYFHWPHPNLRRLIGALLDGFGIEWLVTAEAAPRLEVVPRRARGRLFINLINRGPACSVLPPKRLLIEELPPLRDVRLRVRLPAAPKSVELLPSQQPLVWRYDGGVLTLTVPRVDVHEVLVLGPG